MSCLLWANKNTTVLSFGQLSTNENKIVNIIIHLQRYLPLNPTYWSVKSPFTQFNSKLKSFILMGSSLSAASVLLFPLFFYLNALSSIQLHSALQFTITSCSFIQWLKLYIPIQMIIMLFRYTNNSLSLDRWVFFRFLFILCFQTLTQMQLSLIKGNYFLYFYIHFFFKKLQFWKFFAKQASSQKKYFVLNYIYKKVLYFLQTFSASSVS